MTSNIYSIITLIRMKKKMINSLIVAQIILVKTITITITIIKLIIRNKDKVISSQKKRKRNCLCHKSLIKENAH